MAKVRIEGTIDIGDVEINTAIYSIKFTLSASLGGQFTGIVVDDAVLQAERDAESIKLAREFNESLHRVFWNDQL